MKKIISLLLILCLAVGTLAVLASCGEDAPSLDTEDFGNKGNGITTSEQTSAESTSETTAEASAETTEETTAETLPQTSDTEEATEETTEETEKKPETTVPEETTKERTAEWPEEEILAAIGYDVVPEFDGYFEEVETALSPYTLHGIDIYLYDTSKKDVDAYKQKLLANGYTFNNNYYEVPLSLDGTMDTFVGTSIVHISEVLGCEISVAFYKASGELSAWPEQQIAEAVGEDIEIPVIDGATSFDIGVNTEEIFGISASEIVICCYGVNANESDAYGLSLMNDYGFKTEMEYGELCYVKTVDNTDVIIEKTNFPTMSSDDEARNGVVLKITVQPNTDPIHTMPENVKIAYKKGSENYTAVKIGQDYYVRNESTTSAAFLKYDEATQKWNIWMRDDNSSWENTEESYDDVRDVEAAVFDFIVQTSVNIYTEAGTQEILGITANKYTLDISDIQEGWFMYLLQDPETKLILENGIVGLELASSKVTSIDKTVTEFDVQIPSN